MALRVAVLGATGNVGREMLNILEERRFPADSVSAIASRRSKGKEVSYGDRILKCEDVEQVDWSKFDVCLMSAGTFTSNFAGSEFLLSKCCCCWLIWNLELWA